MVINRVILEWKLRNCKQCLVHNSVYYIIMMWNSIEFDDSWVTVSKINNQCWLNSLCDISRSLRAKGCALGRWTSLIKCVNFKHISMTDNLIIFCWITLRWMHLSICTTPIELHRVYIIIYIKYRNTIFPRKVWKAWYHSICLDYTSF